MLSYKAWIWTLVFSSIRIARSGDIPLLLAKFKTLIVLNVMVHIRLNITTTLLGIVKQTSRLISYILKPNRMNYALILSSTWTVNSRMWLYREFCHTDNYCSDHILLTVCQLYWSCVNIAYSRHDYIWNNLSSLPTWRYTKVFQAHQAYVAAFLWYRLSEFWWWRILIFYSRRNMRSH